jgi:hypothetical protein
MLETPEMTDVVDHDAHDAFMSCLASHVKRTTSWCTSLSSGDKEEQWPAELPPTAYELKTHTTLDIDRLVLLFHKAYGGSGLKDALVSPEELGLEVKGTHKQALRECRRFGVYALHAASSGENLRSLTMALQIYNAFLIYCTENI